MKKTRRGVSLVELLLVMSSAMVILTLSARLIHRIMHAQSKTRSFADVERTALRLASAFRQDAHRALAATKDAGDGVLVRLELPNDQAIEYRRQEGAVLRIVLEPASPAAKSKPAPGGSTIAREQFVFPGGIEVQVDATSPRLIELSIRSRADQPATREGRPATSAFAMPVDLGVIALVNRRAFAAATAPPKQPMP